MTKKAIQPIFAILLLVPVLGCNKHDKNTSVFGKYYNTYQRNVVHYVELKNDSTYTHYFKSESLEQTNNGNWRADLDGDGNFKIAFLEWESYGIKDHGSCEKCYWAVELKNGELFFSYDSPEEMNFRKDEK